MTEYDFYSVLILFGVVIFVYLDKWITHKLNKTNGW
jgi:hypothetical protein